MANKTFCKLTTRLLGIPHYVLTYKIFTDDTHFVCFTYYTFSKEAVYEEYVGMKQENVICSEIRKEYNISKVFRNKIIVLETFVPLVV